MLFAGCWLLAAVLAVMHWRIVVWTFFAVGMLALPVGGCVIVYVIIADRLGEIRAIAAVRRRRIRWIDRMVLKSRKKRSERVEKRRRGSFYHEVREAQEEKV